MNSTTSSHSSKRIRFAQLFLEKTFVGPKRSAAPGNVKAVMDRSINGKSEPTQLEKVADDESPRAFAAETGRASMPLLAGVVES